jgi:hypothetical protein
LELVSAYQKLTKFDHLHYIAVESIINRVTENFRGKPKNDQTLLNMKFDLEVELAARKLDQYFQLEITSKNSYTVGIKVHEINPFNKPKESVIWN